MIPIISTTDINYMPGLIALLESIKRNGNLPQDQKYIVLETEKISQRDKDLFKRFELDIEFQEHPDYSDVCLDWFTGWQGLEWYSWTRKVMKLICLFNMTQYQKIIWIEPDMVCTGDLNELSSFESFSARPDFGETQAMVFDHPQVNSGLMIISPCEEDYKGMIKIVSNNPRPLLKIIPGGDQTIISHYFWQNKPNDIHLLDWKWGVNKRTVNKPEIFKEHSEDMRLLHYVGFKPWWGSDAPEYIEIEKQWHKFWDQAKERLIKEGDSLC